MWYRFWEKSPPPLPFTQITSMGIRQDRKTTTGKFWTMLQSRWKILPSFSYFRCCCCWQHHYFSSIWRWSALAFIHRASGWSLWPLSSFVYVAVDAVETSMAESTIATSYWLEISRLLGWRATKANRQTTNEKEMHIAQHPSNWATIQPTKLPTNQPVSHPASQSVSQPPNLPNIDM